MTECSVEFRAGVQHGRAARCNPPAFRISLAALLSFLALARAVTAEEAAPFRLCADPDNLPFSSTLHDTPGFYIELGREIAAQLGRSFEPVWTPTYFAERAVRTTLLAGRCDGFVGLPDDPDFMAHRLVFSEPIVMMGYALVLPQALAVKDLSDLAGRRVAVQFASPPQSLLATRTDLQPVTVTSPEEAMQDLARGQVDAAFIWGPSAGWIDKIAMHNTYKVIPVAGPHMQWRAAIGFPREQIDLRDQVDRALRAVADTVDALMARYGFPRGAPIRLAASDDATSDQSEAAWSSVATSATHASTQQPAVSSREGPLSPNDTEQVAAGHKLFNDNCAHCHGPDAIQGERRINLRRLHHRYGDDADRVFLTTVTHGRVTKGMPNWAGILTDEQFHEILAFLHSVQEP
jgi:polar amino acid transport system substrate-binding protein